MVRTALRDALSELSGTGTVTGAIESRLLGILEQFYERMSQDVLIGFFFSKKDLGKIARNQRDLILRAAGIKETYSGKLPATAHLELAPILKGHFDRRLVILGEVLRAHGLSDQAIAAWLEFERAFENAIVS